MQANEDVTVRFRKAISTSLSTIKEDSDKAKSLLRERFSDIEDNIYDAAWSSNLKSYPVTPQVQLDGIKRRSTSWSPRRLMLQCWMPRAILTIDIRVRQRRARTSFRAVSCAASCC